MPTKIDPFPPTKPWEEGRIVAGRYTSTRKPQGADSFIHEFRRLDGTNETVWGTTVLDASLSQINQGVYVAIRCDGKGKEAKKGNPPWLFSVVTLSDSEAGMFEAGKMNPRDTFGDAPF